MFRSMCILAATALSYLLCFPTFGDELDEICGRYARNPAENGWHQGVIERDPSNPNSLVWRNQASVSWRLMPDLSAKVLHTNEANPYFANGSRDFELIQRGGRVAGFRFNGDVYVRDGAAILGQSHFGLHGYIIVNVARPPEAFMYGYGFYSNAFPLLQRPLSGFQAGLAGTWIIPDNRDFNKPLCPPGTFARDNWPERGPTYADVFQTIEGSLGFWATTKFGTATPKYRMNGTTNGYTSENSSPGWGFGTTSATSQELMSIAQLSNRILVPPDGLTFVPETRFGLMGIAWMALPLVEAVQTQQVMTGDQSWTCFVNTANFSGPVAFFIPDAFSRLSRGYRDIRGRGLDSRPGSVGTVGMEIAVVPCFEARDDKGVLYRRIPQLNFPASERGQTLLTRDIAAYSKAALYNAIRAYHSTGRLPSGQFQASGIYYPQLTLSKAKFDQGPQKTPIENTEQFFEETLLGQDKKGYGLQWAEGVQRGRFPEYFREENGKMFAIKADEVPSDLHLHDQEFAPADKPVAYTSPNEPDSAWRKPGPVAGPFQATLTDGSVVTFAWYRFADQPSIVAQGWSKQKRERLQTLVEKIHDSWPINGKYLPDSTLGRGLAAIDSALIVAPPAKLKTGYVPIVIRQEAKSGTATGREKAPAGKKSSVMQKGK